MRKEPTSTCPYPHCNANIPEYIPPLYSYPLSAKEYFAVKYMVTGINGSSKIGSVPFKIGSIYLSVK